MTGLSQEKCLTRREKYQANKDIIFPSQFASFTINEVSAKKAKGLSAGIATGVLMTELDLGEITQSKILYTKVLSPGLTKYFNQIEGVVSEQGGLLSHLAIMAREAGLPVVISRQSLIIDQVYKINGATGVIEQGEEKV